MRRLPYNVQRDMAFHRTVVGFRNAVERMLVTRGRNLDTEHLWWGFGTDRGRGDASDDGDDGLAGSRVPRRPSGGVGGAALKLGEWDEREAEALG